MSANAKQPLTYNPRGVFLPRTGLDRFQLESLAPQLVAARDEALADIELWRSGSPVPAAKRPLDAGFIDLPEQLLGEYRQNREQSELGRILAAARRLAGLVDRVVVLGIGGSYMGARALLEGCAHPFYNELSRAERAGWPRLYFDGNNVDNDATQGLLDLLRPSVPSASIDNGWGIVVISKSGGTLETAAAFRLYLARLREACGGDGAKIAERIVPVTGPSGKLFDLADALGCPEKFAIPDGVGGRFSVLTAVGLLPAALAGLDVVALLQGAADMNARFRQAPPGENPVLDFTGVCHLMERERGATIRILSAWSKRLEAAGLWYDQLLSESLGKDEHGATPITVVNTRDLHSRGQQHQAGRRDKLITNVIVDRYGREGLKIGESDFNQDGLDELGDKSLPDVMAAAIAGTNQAYAEDGRPTADLHFPMVDEYALGQFFQMTMLATVVEGRLIGVNPYGQPGVEGYKKHMNALLRAPKR